MRDILIELKLQRPLRNKENNTSNEKRFFVDLEKDFIGKDVLLKQKTQGISRKIACFSSDSRRSPRSGHKIYDEAGEVIGEVASGTFSPGLQVGIGLGFVATSSFNIGKKIFFGDEKNKATASIVKRPFYKNGSLKH